MNAPEASGPTTTGAPASGDDAARRRRTIMFFAVIGAAAVVAVVAVLVAGALSGNTSSGIRATTSSSGASTSTGAASAATAQLPQLAIVLNRTDAVSQMPASNQVVALQSEIATHPTAERYLDLGQAEMSLADQGAAVSAFSHAAQLAPNAPEPLVGLAMTAAMSGGAGLQTANAELQTLQSRFPTNQVVAFNLGWLALYRRDAATVKTAWRRTVQLGKQTPLGIAATVLLAQIGTKTAK
jgi:cytochrome c-type biogenesis protein CcmH/NrfG